ncbi:MAG TPA: hypothetical protein VHM89_02645 [Acidimicrobiales bacterium]|nr:hypothetical protein [Acidimicrobiales bacterium]
MKTMCWRSEGQRATAGSGAPVSFRHVKPLVTAAGYQPAVVGGTAFRIDGANGWPTGLAGDPAG